MFLLLPERIAAQLIAVLNEVGAREVGGVLMGEHVGTNTFRVTDITVQKKGGTFASFVRFVGGIVGPLRAFFQATRHDYTRFNYLGEWHSHHSFALNPSSCDHKTMQDLVTDSTVGARFVVLLLVRQSKSGELQQSVTVYLPDAAPRLGTAILERQMPP